MMKPKNIICPYDECKKKFERLILLTDFSKTPKETYYACPNCFTRIDLAAKDSNIYSDSAEKSHTPVEKTTMDCAYHFGHLKTLPRKGTIPDECLVCPKLLKCY